MDRSRIINTLGLVPGGGLLVTDVRLVQWGYDVVLCCRYNLTPVTIPPEDPVEFELVFHDCREIKYRVYAHISIHEQGLVPSIADVADVAEISLGHGNHRRDANILTNHFAITISYGDLAIERDSHVYPLET
jgi:hypothetical protein